MKSMIGFLMLLFSATTALANDYQIIPGTYSDVGSSPNVSFAFKALVVDLTSGPIYLCIGQMNVLTSTATVGCQKTTVHGGAAMPPGPAALSPLGQGASLVGDGLVAYPGIWKVSSGIVIFCSSNANGLEPDLYCATTKLQQ
jgi:hypothetical protein